MLGLYFRSQYLLGFVLTKKDEVYVPVGVLVLANEF